VVSIIAIAIPLRLGAQVSDVRLGDKTHRPLSEAADLFESKFGWIVTYEDVAVAGADVADSTALARPRTPNTAYRTLVPTGLPFAFVLDEGKATEPDQVGAPAVISTVLDAYNKSGNPGQFQAIAMRVPGGRVVYRLIPSKMRDDHGQLAPYTPLLDSRITLPSRKRSLYEFFDEISRQLKIATGVRFDWGPYALNYLMQTYVDSEAKNEVARDVLRRVLIEKTAQRPLSWWMFCDPHGQLCSLNVHEVGAIHTQQ
jgi:hypothetical protein